MSKTHFVAGALLLAAIGAGVWMTRDPARLPPSLPGAAGAQEATVSSAVAAAPDMILGKLDAPVEVIEYASFTCPHRANFHATVFDRLKADYIDTGKVKFVYREVYFDKFGLWAAMIARCGGPEKYFPISDMIYDTQKQWIGDGEPATIAENLRKIGLKAGLTQEAVEACLNDNEKAKALVAAYQANATRDGIDSTPSFVIDGEKYSNMSYEDFARILDEKLAD